MKRLHVAILIVLLVVSAVSVVRLVDPTAKAPAEPQINLSEPPEEIAHAALLSTEKRDFTVEFSRRQTVTKTNRSLSDDRRIEYDNKDKQARADISAGDGNRTYFANPYFRWTRIHDTTQKTESRNRPRDRFHNEDILYSCDCVRLDGENETTLVLVIGDTNAASQLRYGKAPRLSDENITITLYIDKNSESLQRAVVDYRLPQLSNGERTGATVVGKGVDEYSDWGETDVRRPSWAGYSFREIFADLLNVERRHWIGADSWNL